MKKLLLTVLLATGLTGLVFAAGSDKEGREYRKAVKERQTKAYVEAALAAVYGQPSPGPWGGRAITREFQQAAFIGRSVRKSLFFSPDNARLSARMELVAPTALSARMTRKLARKYKGYQIAQVVQYFDGETLYFVSLKKDREEVLVSYARSLY